jgi:hypothetical protein
MAAGATDLGTIMADGADMTIDMTDDHPRKGGGWLNR